MSNMNVKVEEADFCRNKHIREWPPGNLWLTNQDGRGKKFLEKFCAIELIGKGGFATVYKGQKTVIANGKVNSIKEEYAFKVLPYNDLTEKSKPSSAVAANSSTNPHRQRNKREVDVHEELYNSENVVKPIKILKWPLKKTEEVLLCMEYCPLGDLEKFLKTREFTEVLACKVVSQVVKGLLDLRQIGYFHRDVKASNVFVTGSESDPTFKLGDFGLVANLREMNDIVCGTPSAMAPEMRGAGHPYDEKVDIWSLGILLYCKLLKRHPYHPHDFAKLKTHERVQIQNKGWTFPEDCGLSMGMKELIKNMLELNKYQRISLERIELKIQELTRFQIQSDSGFMTSSQISANTTNQLKASMFQKPSLLPAVHETSNIYRPNPNGTGYRNQQPLRPNSGLMMNIPSVVSSIPPPAQTSQASPMPSTCHSRTVSSLLPPLNTLRLRPSTKLHQFSNGSAKIQSDGSVFMQFVKTKEVIQHGRRTKLNDGNETFIISGDGQRIEIQRNNENCRFYKYEDLPSKYWSKYNYAAKFVGIAREQTPKITYYSDKAICRLMENSPDANFDMTLYANGVRFTYHAVKGIKIIWPPSALGKTEQYSVHTLSLDPSHELAFEWKLFLRERERLLKLEKLLETFVEQEGGSGFPQTIGKRPSSMSA